MNPPLSIRSGTPSRARARIYFVGSHATGKTTMARYVSDRYHLPLISEVARSVLAEMEISLDQIRSNLDTVNRYQFEVFRRQIQEEQTACGGFVSDRAFCNLAYAAEHSTLIADIFRDPCLQSYMDWVGRGLVFFVRPHPDLVQSDGVRAGLRWEDVVRVDGMVKLLLEMYGIPYITIASLSMQERARLVDEVIELRYAELAQDARPHFQAPTLHDPFETPPDDSGHEPPKAARSEAKKSEAEKSEAAKWENPDQEA